MNTGRKTYFIRVTNVGLFNAIVRAAEKAASGSGTTFDARRVHGYYELVTDGAALWQELYLYGQMLAQAQDENIEGGEERPA